MSDAAPLPPIVFAPFNPNACKHLHWTIARDEPEVTCKECGKTLDPYWCMRQMASGYMQTDYRLAEWKEYEEKRQAEQERDRLRRAQRAARKW